VDGVDHTLNIRLIAYIFAANLAVLLLITALDVLVAPTSPMDLHGSATLGRTLASTVSRAYNVIFSMVVSAIALAIPITANMYTPKLVEIFVRDRYTIGVFGFFVFSCTHAIWVTAITWEGPDGTMDLWARVNHYAILLEMLLGFAIMLPFLRYASGFLNPSTIIRKVTEEILAEFDAVERRALPVAEQQMRLNQTILHLGNVILRAIDRADRDVALEAIRSLGRVIDRYDGIKSFLAPDWFIVGKEILSGLGSEAVQFVCLDRTWVEYRCITQLSLAYNATLSKMPDAVSAISETLRHIAIECYRSGDRPVLTLLIRFFNTFVREAIKRKDVHAIYDLMHQYKALVREILSSEPALSLECARHFKYYAEFAKFSGLPFIYELTSYEIGELVKWAYARRCPSREEMLALFLKFDGTAASARLAKSRAILWTFLAAQGLTAEADRVRASLLEVPASILESARADLLGATERAFWEVTDRQVNIDFLEDDAKALARSLFEGLEAEKAAAKPAAAKAEARA